MDEWMVGWVGVGKVKEYCWTSMFPFSSEEQVPQCGLHKITELTCVCSDA